MAGMGLNSAAKMYTETLKPQILKAMQDGLKETFGGVSNEVSDAMALKFAQKVADELAGPICDTIVGIVQQAQISGILATPVPVTGALGPGTGTPVTILPTDLSIN